MRPQPLPTSQADVNAIPQNQRGVSFFSGQPAPLGSLMPVTVTINGQSRQVLVTPEEADELRQGRMPQVRAFRQGNQWVPWYEYPAYDPYRDYWQYENSGWGGFGTGLVAGFIGAELIDSLFAPEVAYASPWAFATDDAYYQGYADAQNNWAGGWDAGSVGDWNTANVGGWGGDAPPQDAGSFDFNNSDFTGGNWDNGGADSGGGWDSGGSDSGSFDFGGGDSGGGSSDW
jgi:hypothetical protein